MKRLLRNLLRNKAFTIINILGLSIGIACVFTIALWLKHETNFDTFHKNHERIYRITFEINLPNGYQSHFARTQFPWVGRLPETFPEVESIAQLGNMTKTTINYNDVKTSAVGYGAESRIFKVLNINLLEGDTSLIFNNPEEIIISESLKKKLFGNEEPIGKTVKLKSTYFIENNSYKVVGVFKDLPENTHLSFDYLTTFTNIESYGNWAYYYLKLKEGTNPDSLSEKIYAMLEKDNPDFERSHRKIHFQPISEIHLHSHKAREMKPNGDIQQVYIFLSVAVLIVIISLVNYFNLNTALIDKRFRTIMLRRIIGARKRDIIYSVAAEALFIGATSIILAWICIEQLIPFLEQFVFFEMPELNTENYIYLLKISILVLLLIVMVAALPFLTFKRFSNLIFSKLEYTSSLPHNLFLRKLLVVIQFTISITLIISILIIRQQTHYALSNSMADKQSSVLCLNFNNFEVMQNYKIYKHSLEKHAIFEDITAIMECPPREIKDVKGFECSAVPEDKKEIMVYVLPTEENFVEFFNLELIAGEGFPKHQDAHKKEDYILNRKATEILGWKNPEDAIGNDFKLLFPEFDTIFKGGKIVGVLEDFHFSSLHKEIQPLAIFQKSIWYFSILLKYNPKNETKAIQLAEEEWNNQFPEYPFEYSFLDDEYKNVYKKELSTLRVLSILVVLMIFISAMGLFALTAIITERRTKEIAIRKVNGAKASNILMLFSKSFQRLVIIAFAIAIPLAFYITNQWLSSFIYQTAINWWFYLLGGIVAFAIVQLTISWQCVKTAKKNPVNALNSE